jgi:hypothetical protein
METGLRTVEPDVDGPAGELPRLGLQPVNARGRSQAYANNLWLLIHGLVDVQ